jgi:hypothetical protein
MSHLATLAQADAEYALNVGMQRPHQAWVLSDRDVWYRNPAYCGPAVRHPEDDAGDDDQDVEDAGRRSGAVVEHHEDLPF